MRRTNISSGLAVSSRVVLLLIALAIVVVGFYFAKQSGDDPEVYSNDFNVFYHAAGEVLGGRDPYQRSLGEWTPYLYPPLLAVLLTPLVVLPLPVAAYVWFLINAVSTITAAWMSARLARDGLVLKQTNEDARAAMTSPAPPGFLVPLAAVSLLVVARFVLDNLNLGQVNLLVAALVAAHVYLYSKDKKTASALALAIAASIKLTPVVLVGYHVARRRYKFAAACLGLFVGLTALSFAPLGSRAPDGVHEFVSRTIKNEQGFDLAYAGNQSLRGLIARMALATHSEFDQGASESSRQPSDAMTLLISLALLAIAMIAASRARSELISAAPFVCCFVLLSPLSWKAHFVALILPVASLAAEAARARGSRRQALIALLVLVFLLFNFTSPHVIGLRAAEWADQHSLVFTGAMLCWAGCVWTASVTPKK
jgi:alpha-1,2-mannosyltransferase